MSDSTPQLPDHVVSQINDLQAKIADPSTPTAHKTFLQKVLDLILKFLPSIIDLFHPSAGTTLPTGIPAATGPAAGPGAGVAASAGADADGKSGGQVDPGAAAGL
jgi:hypothetical protein